VQISALFYLGAILLVIGLVTNLLAQLIIRRFDVQRAGMR
jgi:ABC-type phosphate transport system permease subunit